eukprot:COSAG06_NODE_15020_length_1104_cov_1.092537_1_plen_165_part_10
MSDNRNGLSETRPTSPTPTPAAGGFLVNASRTSATSPVPPVAISAAAADAVPLRRSEPGSPRLGTAAAAADASLLPSLTRKRSRSPCSPSPPPRRPRAAADDSQFADELLGASGSGDAAVSEAGSPQPATQPPLPLTPPSPSADAVDAHLYHALRQDDAARRRGP